MKFFPSDRLQLVRRVHHSADQIYMVEKSMVGPGLERLRRRKTKMKFERSEEWGGLGCFVGGFELEEDIV